MIPRWFPLLLATLLTCHGESRKVEAFTPVSSIRLLNGLGWNVTLDREWEFAKVAAAHGKEARFQFSWDAVETMDGDLKLPPKFEAALGYCAKYQLEPMIVAAYGPPRAKLLELTVSADVPAGTLTLPVTGDLPQIRVPDCHVTKADRSQLVAEGRWAYYGALIDAVDPVAQTITLAAKTKTALAAGTVLTVNRLRYPSVASETVDDPSVVAYGRYVRFLAERIAAYGLHGTVEIWNEPPWSHDPWDHRSGFYDNPPASLSKNSPNWGLLRSLLKETLPPGVRYTWGGSHKSGTRGLLSLPAPAPARAEIEASVASEGWHPYGPTPEWNAWYPELLETSKDLAAAGLEGSNLGSNFKQGRRKAAQQLKTLGWTVPEQISEAGLATADQNAKARWITRFFLVQMCLGPQPQLDRVNFYRLSEAAEGYAMIEATTQKELPAYIALKELMNELALFPVAPADFSSPELPTIAGEYRGDFPLATIPILGRTQAGAARTLFVTFQRTYAPTDAAWIALNPAPATITVQLPEGAGAARAVDLVTRQPVAISISGSKVSYAVGANPVALQIEAAH
jgi:hypothetical protein